MKCINSATPNGNPDAKANLKKKTTTGTASEKKTESKAGK